MSGLIVSAALVGKRQNDGRVIPHTFQPPRAPLGFSPPMRSTCGLNHYQSGFGVSEPEINVFSRRTTRQSWTDQHDRRRLTHYPAVPGQY